MQRQMMDIFNLDLGKGKNSNNEQPKKAGFYFMNITEIEHDELIEETNATKTETSLINDLPSSESADLIEYSDSVISSVDLNLNDTYFVLEEIPITTKSSPTLTNSDSSSEEPLAGSANSNPNVGDIFFYILFAYIIFNTVDKYLNRGRRRLNPLAWIDQPIEVKDKTEEELNDHLVTKTIVPCSTKLNENNNINNNESDIEGGIIHSNPSTISIDQLSLDEDNTCAICIDTFDIGDEVSWSRYHRCNHVFHYECIIPWLKRHDECPYCRCNYIMPTLERTEIADDFIYCVNHGGLAKLGECWNNNERMDSDEISSVSCINCNIKDEGLIMFGAFVNT